MTLATSPFGSTGHESSRVIFGGAALGGMRQRDADAAIASFDRSIDRVSTVQRIEPS
jgi:hypothetical protein